MLQTDGKIVMAGSDGGIALTRYSPGGALDATFGEGGKAILPPKYNTSDAAVGAVLGQDGKIVVAANHIEGNSAHLVLERFWP